MFTDLLVAVYYSLIFPIAASFVFLLSFCCLDKISPCPPSPAGLPNGTTTAAMNGASNSDESLDELPEEDVDTRQDTDTKSLGGENRKTHLINGHSSTNGGSTHHSPVASRLNTSQGHRRTGSDPFAFRPHHLYSSSRTSHPRFTIGAGSAAINGSSATSPTTDHSWYTVF